MKIFMSSFISAKYVKPKSGHLYHGQGSAQCLMQCLLTLCVCQPHFFLELIWEHRPRNSWWSDLSHILKCIEMPFHFSCLFFKTHLGLSFIQHITWMFMSSQMWFIAWWKPEVALGTSWLGRFTHRLTPVDIRYHHCPLQVLNIATALCRY